MSIETQLKTATATRTADAPTAKAPKAKKVAPKEAAKDLKPKVAAVKVATPEAAKAKPEPKAKAAEAKPTDRRTPHSNDSVIKVLKTEHEIRGFRGAALDAIKDGMTVEKYKVALKKLGGRMGSYTGWALTTAIARKMITVKS